VSPEVIILTATDNNDPHIQVVESFWRSTYAEEADRLMEANGFIDKMVGRGYTVIAEYK
jgi:hypothetical protein